MSLFLLNQRIHYSNFHESFLQNGNSLGVIDSKILPLNCLMLFLILSRITWLIRICSCNNISLVSVKLVYFVQSWFYSLVVGILVRQKENRK